MLAACVCGPFWRHERRCLFLFRHARGDCIPSKCASAKPALGEVRFLLHKHSISCPHKVFYYKTKTPTASQPSPHPTRPLSKSGTVPSRAAHTTLIHLHRSTPCPSHAHQMSRPSREVGRHDTGRLARGSIVGLLLSLVRRRMRMYLWRCRC